MSVVPVSMAARLPDGKVTEFPLTLIPVVDIRVRKSQGDKGIRMRTRDGEEPVSLPPRAGDERKELDVACEEGLILTAESEDPTKLFCLGASIIQESGKPEAHLGGRQLVALCKILPEWDSPGVGNGVKCKTHDTSIGTVEKASRGLIDQEPGLVLNLKSAHSHGISDEITSNGTGTISNCDSGWLTGGTLALLEATRGATVEVWGTRSASGTSCTSDPQVRRARV